MQDDDVGLMDLSEEGNIKGLHFIMSESAAWRLALQRRFQIQVYRWMCIKQVQRAGAQFENLNGRLGPALDPKPCSLPCWTRSIRIPQNGT